MAMETDAISARKVPYVVAIIALLTALVCGVSALMTRPDIKTNNEVTNRNAITLTNKRQDIAAERQWLRDINKSLDDAHLSEGNRQRLLESRQRCESNIHRMEEELRTLEADSTR